MPVNSIEELFGADRYADLTAVLRARARVQASAKLIKMAARGALRRPRMRACGGPLLLGHGVRFRNAGHISTDGWLMVEDYAEVQGLSRQGIHFGSQVSIGAFAMIRPSGYYKRDIGEGLHVGDRSSIGPYCYIGCSGFVTIGQDVMLGPGVRLFAEDHNFKHTDTSIKSQGVIRKQIVIGDDCWIASGVTITGGVTIGRGSVVAAGSVVTQDIPALSVFAGVPARRMRGRGES